MEEKYIKIIIDEAKKASKHDEVPVGAIIVKKNKIISKAHNIVEKKKNSILHAEIVAISKASRKLKNWRLNDCEMYVTLEPCEMCKSAIKLCRIKKVYYLLKKDKKNNNKTSYVFLNKYKNDSLKLLQQFFKEKR